MKVATSDTVLDETDDGILDALQDLDRRARLEMAFEAPPLSTASAVWAASKLYRVCQLFVFRDTEDATRRALAAPCPEQLSDSVAYSVDLSFRFLPDIVTLVRAASGAEPLLAELLRLAQDWPLSSVGIQPLDVSQSPVDCLLCQPGLKQLYVDRIIARNDIPRASHGGVRDAIREALGLFPSLAPPWTATVQCMEQAP